LNIYVQYLYRTAVIAPTYKQMAVGDNWNKILRNLTFANRPKSGKDLPFFSKLLP